MYRTIKVGIVKKDGIRIIVERTKYKKLFWSLLNLIREGINIEG
jgi:hypothetical protein